MEHFFLKLKMQQQDIRTLKFQMKQPQNFLRMQKEFFLKVNWVIILQNSQQLVMRVWITELLWMFFMILKIFLNQLRQFCQKNLP